MDLDIRLLRYFVAVAEELNFSKAAQRLHISQPPLSVAIRQLEELVDANLLLRTSRRVELTAAGRALYHEALFLLRRQSDVRSLVQRVAAGLQGQLKIGYVGSMLYRGLSHVLHACRERHPGMEHILLELNSAEQIELIERGGLDIGFIHANPTPTSVVRSDLAAEPFIICVPDRHPLADDAYIELSELADQDFIFFSRSFSPSYYETLLAMCLQAGFFPRVRNEARHWLSVLSLVSQGMGVSIVPECMSRSGMAGLRFLPFEHAHQSVSSLIWSAHNPSPAKNECIALIRQAYTERPDGAPAMIGLPRANPE